MLEPRLVVAHFMVGNTYPYTKDDWLEDIQLAQKHSLDAFALNVGRESWQCDRIADCFDAALKAESKFKLFLSFDMSTFYCAEQDDIGRMRALFAQLACRPNYLKVNGAALVSTFSGESSLFGHDDFVHAWTEVKCSLESVAKVCLIPSYFIDPRRYQELGFMDGALHWNGCWPVSLTPNSPRSEIELPTLSSDAGHIIYLINKLYMASVSPWFFTHYGTDSWNKNWIYRGDDWLLVRRWGHLLSIRSQVDIVQMISWNDYGESHYIGPIKGAQPNSEAWVDGFDHTPWLSLNAYFAKAFKDGCFPPIEEFRVYVWARPHKKDAEAGADEVGRPRGWELTDDFFWVVILAPSPAQVELQSRSDETPSVHHVSSGYSKLKHPLAIGGGMHVRISCSGKTVVDFWAEGFEFSAQPETYNFNAFVAMYPPDDA